MLEQSVVEVEVKQPGLAQVEGEEDSNSFIGLGALVIRDGCACISIAVRNGQNSSRDSRQARPRTGCL